MSPRRINIQVEYLLAERKALQIDSFPIHGASHGLHGLYFCRARVMFLCPYLTSIKWTLYQRWKPNCDQLND